MVGAAGAGPPGRRGARRGGAGPGGGGGGGAGPGGAGAAMDAVCRAEPRPRRPPAASSLPWARFSAWLDCVCVVTFDLELGQAMEVRAGPGSGAGGGCLGPGRAGGCGEGVTGGVMRGKGGQ